MACNINCLQCDAITANSTKCTMCNAGYFLNTTGAQPSCQSCPKFCSVCNSSTSCLNCTFPGMYFNDTFNMCLVCVVGCDVCASST